MSKQKLSDLAKKRGIYAVLLLGVFIVIAVIMVMITSNPKESENENLVDLNDTPQNAAQANPGSEDSTYAKGQKENEQIVEVVPEATTIPKAEITKEAETAPETEVAQNPVSEGETTAENTAKPEEVAQTKPVMQAKAENLIFHKEDGLDWPIKGNVILPYSVDKTTYFATLKQYMTNPAILIAGEIGTEVKAAAKGIVTDIVNDTRTGNTITMSIGNDYKLVYGQLGETKLKVGDTVNAGDIIGTIAKATKYFVIEGSHLYFQVYEGENTINPMLLLKSES